MSTATVQMLLYTTWFLSTVEGILALYVLMLNFGHPANRYLGLFLLLCAANTLTTGWVQSLQVAAIWNLGISVLLFPTLLISLLLATVALIKPAWLTGRRRVLQWAGFGLLLVPSVLLTVTLWHGELGATILTSGLAPTPGQLPSGLVGLVRLALVYGMLGSTLLFLVHAVVWDKGLAPARRRLAGWLSTVLVVCLLVLVGLETVLGSAGTLLIVCTILAAAYAYWGLRQMISERRSQRGSLRVRLTILVLTSTVPLLVASVLVVSTWTTDAMLNQADKQLASASRQLVATTSTWLDMNTYALQHLATMPEMASMDGEQQLPILAAMVSSYPHMHFVGTVDLSGQFVAHSGGQPLDGVNHSSWYISARDGTHLATELGATGVSPDPMLIMAMPVNDESGAQVGVVVIASDLATIQQQVEGSSPGQSGLAYIVDSDNRLVVQSEGHKLDELGLYPPVAALREGIEGTMHFQDKEGRQWRAHSLELDNGWGVVVQQASNEVQAPAQQARGVAWAVLGLGSLFLILLIVITVRQALHPVTDLTEIAAAIAEGDVLRVAPVESNDEIGALARAFNLMTEELRHLVNSLEQQVTERTRDLEQKTNYLEATADVGRAVALLLNPEDLIQRAVDLIRERFDLCYVGLFLLDESGEWAVLRSGTGDPANTMLRRGDRIPKGEGMIGWSIVHGEPRIAMPASEDSERLSQPESPKAGSEATLPLRSRGQVIGVLSVQHRKPSAFDAESMAVLQTMADQVAIALDNAKLYTESQHALERVRQAYGQSSRQAWVEYLRDRPQWGYDYADHQVTPLTEGQITPGTEILMSEALGEPANNQDDTLVLPLVVQDEVVGSLSFCRSDDAEAGWSEEERSLLEAFADQLELALDSARLYEETQRRAYQDRLMGDITARMRQTLDVDTVLRTAVREIGTALRLPRVEVRMRPGTGLGSTMPPEPVESVGKDSPVNREGDEHAALD